MRALILNQPFASLIFCGKDLETRLRPTNVRGEVLICSAKKPYSDKTVEDICGAWWQGLIRSALKDDKTKELNGYALGTVYLSDCFIMGPNHVHRTFVPYDYVHKTVRYAWEFKQIKRIEPFEWKFGKQGWLFVPDSELKKIKYL